MCNQGHGRGCGCDSAPITRDPGKPQRYGLDAVRGFIGGIFIRFGVPNTPVDLGYTRRFDAITQEQNDALFWPLSGIPANTQKDRFREASPTGKLRGGEVFARLPAPEITAVDANNLITLSGPAYPAGARNITREQVDAYGSTVGKVSWSPGQMARRAVVG